MNMTRTLQNLLSEIESEIKPGEYKIAFNKDAEKNLNKYLKNNKNRYDFVKTQIKKLPHTAENGNYKHLHKVLAGCERIHFENSKYVLIISIDKPHKRVTLVDFGTHEEMYKYNQKRYSS